MVELGYIEASSVVAHYDYTCMVELGYIEAILLLSHTHLEKGSHHS